MPYHLEQFFETASQAELLEHRFCLHSTKLDCLWQELHLLGLVQPSIKALAIKSSKKGQQQALFDLAIIESVSNEDLQRINMWSM